MYLSTNLYPRAMGVLELREELRRYIEIGDGNFLKASFTVANEVNPSGIKY